MKKSDLDLGMNRPITRRDFLNGASVAVGGVGAIGAASMPSGGVDATEAGSTHQGPGPFGDEYYPPKLTGMRGSHEGSYEVAHEMRYGKTWDEAEEIGEQLRPDRRGRRVERPRRSLLLPQGTARSEGLDSGQS